MVITKPLLALIEHKRRLQKLRVLPIQQPLRNHLLKDYFRHFVFRQFDRGRARSRIAGFDVPFCSLDAFEYLFGEVFVKHSYLVSLSTQQPVIVDAGSNIGMSVLFFNLLWPKATITSFEPQPAAFKCLSELIRDNHLDGRVTAHQAALAASSGKLDFYVDDAAPGSLLASLDSDRMSKNSISVEAKLLSNYISGPIDLLKMDIEGAEFDVLSDLVHSGAISQVKSIILEYHHHIDRDSDQFSHLLRLLEDVGFGYQIEGKLGRPFTGRRFQDLIVYAYNKRA